MSREPEKMEEDLFQKAAMAADELYNIRDTYFPADPNEKVSKLQAESDLALQLLNSIPPGTVLYMRIWVQISFHFDAVMRIFSGF